MPLLPNAIVACLITAIIWQTKLCSFSLENKRTLVCHVQGLFNFKPSVRPVPLECHIQGYPGKFYCPRMSTMNKPAYAAIQTHSMLKPVLVFVSSRRQVGLTSAKHTLREV